METYSTTDQGLEARQDIAPVAQGEVRWNLAFVAILGYLLVEYSRLHVMYPILEPLHLGRTLIVLCFVGLLISRRVPDVGRSSSRSLDFTLFFLLLGVALSALFAFDRTLAWDAFANALRWVVTYFLISRILTSSWRLRIFLLLYMLVNLKLGQFVVRYYFQEIAWGRDQNYLAIHGVGAGSTDFFGNPGDFGVAMCVAWPIAGSLFFNERKKFWRLILLGCFIVFFIAILLCGARGAVVGAATVALAAWLRNPKRLAGAVMVLVAALGILYILPEGDKDKMRSAWNWQGDQTASHRVHLWKTGMRMFSDHPIAGVGIANFGEAFLMEYADQDSRRYPRVAWAPHSIYIEALSETGLAGSVPLLLLWFFFLRLNARTRQHLRALGVEKRSFEYGLSLGLDLALVGYLVSGAFLTVLYYPHLWLLLGLSVGLHTACLRKQPEIGLAELGNQDPKLALAAS